MLKFRTVRYRNFLSTGNTFTEVPLDASRSTLILGENGSGKSTVSDAICFALFNKPFRNINKTQIINSINGKNCVVELEFAIGSKEYKIVRGIKPNVFEIYIDGVLVDQDAASKDYQAYLEESILKLNFKAFTQIVILGSASFVPFMQLPASSRREIIEDILDIRIFSIMNTVLKERVVASKAALTQLESDLALAKQQTKNQDTFIKVLQEDHQQKIEDNRKAIADAEAKITTAKSILEVRENAREGMLGALGDTSAPRLALQNVERSNTDLSRRIATLKQEIAQYEKNPKSLSSTMKDQLALQNAERTTSELSAKIAKLVKEIAQYEKNPICPTCNNKLSDEAVQTAIANRNEAMSEFMGDMNFGLMEIEEAKKAIATAVSSAIAERQAEIVRLEASINDNTTKLVAAQEAMEAVRLGEDQLKVIDQRIAEQKTIIASQTSIIQTLQRQITETEAKTGNIDHEKDTLRQMAERVVSLLDERTALNEEKQYLDIAATMLKDSGIKTKVIRQYLDTINRLVNQYLQAMDFFVLFTLDEEFKEVIKSSFRDEFSYENFSEGEKQRIDLALTLTWRAIAKAKNSMNTNLLILDEVFDSSLDVNGTEYVMRLLDELGADTNVFVISHKGTGIEDKFVNTIRFIKPQNFSLIAG